MPRKLNLTGHRYGKLIVVGEGAPQRASRKHVMWRCRCDCGNTTETRASRLRSGHTTSCGCAVTKQNGLSTHPLYGTWVQMRHRCSNPEHESYKCYGGRGIKVCARWRSFENFLADMGPRPSTKHQIDRKNNNGNYEPGNCRWALPIAQCRNTRTNRKITVLGQETVLSAAAERFNVPYWTVHKRLRLGWTEEQALGLSPRHKKTWTNKWALMNSAERSCRIAALNTGRKRQAAKAREIARAVT